MSASCRSRVRFEVRTTAGGWAARTVPSSGIVTLDSASSSNRNASKSSSARSSSSISSTAGSGPGWRIARSSGRGTRNSSPKSSSSASSVAGRLGGADPQQLARVVPLVERLGGVDPLVALQPDQRSSRAPRRAPSPPRSCRRPPRPRAAAAAAGAGRGRARSPGPGRRGSRPRRGARASDSMSGTAALIAPSEPGCAGLVTARDRPPPGPPRSPRACRRRRDRPRDRDLDHLVAEPVHQLPDRLVAVQLAELAEHLPAEGERVPAPVVVAADGHPASRRRGRRPAPARSPAVTPGWSPSISTSASARGSTAPTPAAIDEEQPLAVVGVLDHRRRR